MVGAIRRLDIVAHPFVTVHCFGWKVFFRALIAGEEQTFLSLLTQTGTLRPSTLQPFELIDRCIKLELQAKRIYEWLAGRFLGYRSTSEFFDNLARQEERHAELLKLCKETARQSGWEEDRLAPWRDAISRLEQKMTEAEASLQSLENMLEALKLVIQIERSEINQLFTSVVAASGAEFVRKLRPFQTAATEHISYICSEIPKLQASLADQCRQLQGSCCA